MAPQGIPREPYTGIDGSLRALAGQAEGFGEDTVGGLEGPVLAVTTLAGRHPECVLLSVCLRGRVRELVGFNPF